MFIPPTVVSNRYSEMDKVFKKIFGISLSVFKNKTIEEVKMLVAKQNTFAQNTTIIPLLNRLNFCVVDKSRYELRNNGIRDITKTLGGLNFRTLSLSKSEDALIKEKLKEKLIPDTPTVSSTVATVAPTVGSTVVSTI